MSKNDDGKLYRVRDKNDVPKKNWGRVWAINLSQSAAVALKDDLAGKRKSKTVRTELMEIVNPGDPEEGGNRDGSWSPPVGTETTPWTPHEERELERIKQLEATPPPKLVASKRPPPPPLGAASAAAAGAAADAQRRHDTQKARAAAEVEAKQRQDELKALSEMNVDLQDDVPQGDVDDLLDGVGEPPPSAAVIAAPDVYQLPTATGVVVYYDRDGLAPDLQGSCMALVLKEWNDDVMTIQIGLETADLVKQDGKVVGVKRLPSGPIMPGVPKQTAEITDRCWTDLV